MRPLSYFEARVEKDEATGCWNWKHGRHPKGYGRFFDSDKRHKRAHRGTWEAANGLIPAGLWVLHRCDNPSCCNPEHLFLGTNEDNVRDKMAKGRHVKGSLSGTSKLTEHDVSIIKMMLGVGVRRHRLAALYGVDPTNISCIKLGKTWTHVAPMEVAP